MGKCFKAPSRNNWKIAGLSPAKIEAMSCHRYPLTGTYSGINTSSRSSRNSFCGMSTTTKNHLNTNHVDSDAPTIETNGTRHHQGLKDRYKCRLSDQ